MNNVCINVKTPQNICDNIEPDPMLSILITSHYTVLVIPQYSDSDSVFACKYTKYKSIKTRSLIFDSVPTLQYYATFTHVTYPAPLSQLLCRSETRHDAISSPKTEKLALGQVRLTPEKENSMFPLQCSQLGHFLSTCSFWTGGEPAHQRREKYWPARFNFVSVSATAWCLMWRSQSSPLFEFISFGADESRMAQTV